MAPGRLLATALVSLWMALPASAGVLPYAGTLTLEFAFGSGRVLPTVEATGSGVATLNGSAGLGPLTALHLDTAIGTGPLVIPITDPAAGTTFPSLRATGIAVQGSESVGFTPGGALSPNGIPVSGTVLICVVTEGCEAFFTVPLGAGGTRGLGIGGGAVTVGGFAQQGLRISRSGPGSCFTGVRGHPLHRGCPGWRPTRRGRGGASSRTTRAASGR